MKWKTIFIVILVSFIVFIIYLVNRDNKVYYLNIIDQHYDEMDTYNDYLKQYFVNENKLEKYIDGYNEQDYRITDLIRDIEDNKKIKIKEKDQSLQNALIKADIVTIRIGNNELKYKIETSEINELFNYCDTMIQDLDKLFKIIKEYCKEEVYFIGYYNEHGEKYDELYKYLNLKIEDIANAYGIHYIPSDQEFNEEENQKIYEKIIKISSLS